MYCTQNTQYLSINDESNNNNNIKIDYLCLYTNDEC